MHFFFFFFFTYCRFRTIVLVNINELNQNLVYALILGIASLDFSQASRVSFEHTYLPLKSEKYGFDALSLVGPTGFKLLDFCSSSVSVLILLLGTHLVSSQC